MAKMKQVVDDMSGESDADIKAKEEALELKEDALEQLEAVKDHLLGMGTKGGEVPAKSWEEAKSEVHFFHKEHSHVGKEIEDLVENIAQGEWKDALKETIKQGVNDIFGNEQIDGDRYEECFCHMSGGGGLARTDVVVDITHVKTKHLESHVHSTAVSAWRTGAIETKGLSINEVLIMLPKEKGKHSDEQDIEDATTLAGKVKKYLDSLNG